MTLPRYVEMKKVWKKSPPVPMCLAAICEWLGMKLGDSSGEESPGESSEIYYDESYYNVPTQEAAGKLLMTDFNRVNGGGMNG